MFSIKEGQLKQLSVIILTSIVLTIIVIAANETFLNSTNNNSDSLNSNPETDLSKEITTLSDRGVKC